MQLATIIAAFIQGGCIILAALIAAGKIIKSNTENNIEMNNLKQEIQSLKVDIE
jgi:hypothetical protein